MKGIPKDAEIATSIAVEGSGMMADEMGINITTVAVLLINAEKRALKMQMIKRAAEGLSSENGKLSVNTAIVPDRSKSLPSVMPPAININVDQSILRRCSFPNMPVANIIAAAVIEVTDAGIPWIGSVNQQKTVPTIRITKGSGRFSSSCVGSVGLELMIAD